MLEHIVSFACASVFMAAIAALCCWRNKASNKQVKGLLSKNAELVSYNSSLQSSIVMHVSKCEAAERELKEAQAKLSALEAERKEDLKASESKVKHLEKQLEEKDALVSKCKAEAEEASKRSASEQLDPFPDDEQLPVVTQPCNRATSVRILLSDYQMKVYKYLEGLPSGEEIGSAALAEAIGVKLHTVTAALVWLYRWGIVARSGVWSSYKYSISETSLESMEELRARAGADGNFLLDMFTSRPRKWYSVDELVQGSKLTQSAICRYCRGFTALGFVDERRQGRGVGMVWYKLSNSDKTKSNQQQHNG